MQLKEAAGPGHLGYHLAPNKGPHQLGRRAGETEGHRGERGVQRKREHPFFLPSSERVAIDTVHLIKVSAPLHLLLLSLEHRAQAAACPARPFKLKCSPLQDGERKKDRDREETRWGAEGGEETLDICHHHWDCRSCKKKDRPNTAFYQPFSEGQKLRQHAPF